MIVDNIISLQWHFFFSILLAKKMNALKLVGTI